MKTGPISLSSDENLYYPYGDNRHDNNDYMNLLKPLKFTTKIKKTYSMDT